MPPLRFLVHRCVGKCAQSSDRLAVNADRGGGDLRSRRLVHERHEFVREARHGAADADAADVWAPANAGHPAAFWHVAIDNRTPAAEFHDALWGTVDFRKIALLVIACAVTSVINGLSEEPGRPQLF